MLYILRLCALSLLILSCSKQELKVVERPKPVVIAKTSSQTFLSGLKDCIEQKRDVIEYFNTYSGRLYNNHEKSSFWNAFIADGVLNNPSFWLENNRYKALLDQHTTFTCDISYLLAFQELLSFNPSFEIKEFLFGKLNVFYKTCFALAEHDFWIYFQPLFNQFLSVETYKRDAINILAKHPKLAFNDNLDSKIITDLVYLAGDKKNSILREKIRDQLKSFDHYHQVLKDENIWPSLFSIYPLNNISHLEELMSFITMEESRPSPELIFEKIPHVIASRHFPKLSTSTALQFYQKIEGNTYQTSHPQLLKIFFIHPSMQLKTVNMNIMLESALQHHPPGTLVQILQLRPDVADNIAALNDDYLNVFQQSELPLVTGLPFDSKVKLAKIFASRHLRPSPLLLSEEEFVTHFDSIDPNEDLVSSYAKNFPSLFWKGLDWFASKNADFGAFSFNEDSLPPIPTLNNKGGIEYYLRNLYSNGGDLPIIKLITQSINPSDLISYFDFDFSTNLLLRCLHLESVADEKKEKVAWDFYQELSLYLEDRDSIPFPSNLPGHISWLRLLQSVKGITPLVQAVNEGALNPRLEMIIAAIDKKDTSRTIPPSDYFVVHKISTDFELEFLAEKMEEMKKNNPIVVLLDFNFNMNHLTELTKVYYEKWEVIDLWPFNIMQKKSLGFTYFNVLDHDKLTLICYHYQNLLSELKKNNIFPVYDIVLPWPFTEKKGEFLSPPYDYHTLAEQKLINSAIADNTGWTNFDWVPFATFRQDPSLLVYDPKENIFINEKEFRDFLRMTFNGSR